MNLSGAEELGFVEVLMGDGDRNSRAGDAGIAIGRDQTVINRRQLAAISTILEVVK